MEIFREQVKQLLKKYIREQLDRTVAGGRGKTAVPATANSGVDLEQLISGLQASFADMDKRKLQQSKRDPRFKNSISEIGDLVAELQNLLAPLK